MISCRPLVVSFLRRKFTFSIKTILTLPPPYMGTCLSVGTWGVPNKKATVTSWGQHLRGHLAPHSPEQNHLLPRKGYSGIPRKSHAQVGGDDLGRVVFRGVAQLSLKMAWGGIGSNVKETHKQGHEWLQYLYRSRVQTLRHHPDKCYKDSNTNWIYLVPHASSGILALSIVILLTSGCTSESPNHCIVRLWMLPGHSFRQMMS